MLQPDPEVPVVTESRAAGANNLILLGRITGIYGLQGWVKVHSDTSPRENIISYSQWWVEQAGALKAVVVRQGRPQGKTIVASLDGIDSPEAAASLVGASIAVERAAMPALADDEFYWADLTGLHVRTVGGVDVGPVVRLFETGANDVMVIADHRTSSEGGGREVLVPWVVPDVVTEVDVENRVITIDWDPDF